MDETTLAIPSEYGPFLEDLKNRIRLAQVRATVAVNSELVMLYWNIGRRILTAQEAEGYGTRIVSRLAVDLSRAFPDTKGFSPRNLNYMLAFARAWTDEQVLQTVSAKLTWSHNIALLEKLPKPELRIWYANQAIAHGWSLSVLVHQIESKLYERQGKAVTNFTHTMVAPQSDLARQILKDPYNFEFLTLQGDVEERELEKGLIDHIRKFLLELGAGFAFVGNQYHIEVGGEDFYIDLLFYHLRLRCYVVIELKTGKFKPEYAGKLNFYLAVVDDLVRHPEDAPTIGLILCKDKSQVVAEYALRGMTAPMGVSAYQIAEALPDTLKGSLPTIAELEHEFRDFSSPENS